MAKKDENVDSFRDRVTSIDESGKRNWVYAFKPSGRYYNARTWLSFAFLIFFFAMPFVKVNGHPFFLFNILERKFILFGKIFWPQDFFLFGFAMITGFVFIILFTVVFGRLFCGWVCPQTIFMELVFRKIEYWIEGTASQQKLLDKSNWNFEKLRKKLSKWIVFFAISFLISNAFLAYIIGIDELFAIMTEPPSQHAGGLSAMLIFSGVFFFVFAWFREQACTVVCPYGRLQGVLLDKNSIVVAYDYVRGEPRGKAKASEPLFGDCIDCDLCVKVCPTGIDIRNGTQLECTNCTACIDACDSIMDKVSRPRGLIRYASESQIAENKPFAWNLRIKAYSLVLIGLLVVLTSLLMSRTNVDVTIIRVPGQLFQEKEDGQISNLYNIKLLNKTFENLSIELVNEDGLGTIEWIGRDSIEVPGEGQIQATFFLTIPAEKLLSRKTKLRMNIYSDGKLIDRVKTNFLGPVK
jgi:cytochrome c oxidase accessory protein FixG